MWTIVGSRADSGSVFVRGTDAATSRRITGSCDVTIHRTKSTAMLFSMIVVITSWAPVFAFSTPGMPPQKAPPSTPARVTTSSASGAGTSAIHANVPTHAAAVAPTRS